MTLNDLEHRNSPYLAFFLPNLTNFKADYITVVEDYNIRKILSPTSSLLFLAKTITHPAARSLCDSWATCYVWCCHHRYRCIGLVVRWLNWWLMGHTGSWVTFYVGQWVVGDMWPTACSAKRRKGVRPIFKYLPRSQHHVDCWGYISRWCAQVVVCMLFYPVKHIFAK